MNNKVIKLSVALSTLIFISPTIVLGADNLMYEHADFENNDGFSLANLLALG